MTPIDSMMAGDDPTLSGFDMDFSKLIFTRVRCLASAISRQRMLACAHALSFRQMLGLNLSYIASATFVEMYLALRSGTCDVGIVRSRYAPLLIVR